MPKKASGGNEMLRLLLVEDHAAFRGALALLLDLRPGMRVVAQCGSWPGAEPSGGLLQTVDVALVDLKLPDGEGTEFIAVLRGANPSVRVLILTVSIEPGLQGRMAEAGADGVLDKTAALSEMASEVARLGRGG
jgi:DNA-binding NarL/FixJ family response regulator